MERLDVIQKEHNLNEVFREGGVGPGGAYHHYVVIHAAGKRIKKKGSRTDILFQKGPRKDKSSVHGILDGDLLEIVRDRLMAFQAGPFACEENAKALKHVENALKCFDRRAQERAKRNVLGTMEK